MRVSQTKKRGGTFAFLFDKRGIFDKKLTMTRPDVL